MNGPEDEARSELSRLLDQYPLPGGWSAPECHLETADLQGFHVNLVGLLSQRQAGQDVVGSAAAPEELPVRRAYFELLERICICEALASDDAFFDGCDANGAAARVARSQVFPGVPAAAGFSYSRSNAVAAHTDRARACDAARAELVERDRLLRAWYGELRPRRVPLPSSLGVGGLATAYVLEAYTVPPSARGSDAGLEVAAVFGFPKQASSPLIWGSACSQGWEEALQRAATECVQRAGFLWGESIPGRAPEVSRNAEFHQEFFLYPGAHDRLRRWLAGEHAGYWPRSATLEQRVPESARLFADVGRGRVPGLWVMRAIPAGELPLVFGLGHPALPNLPGELAVHPIC